MNKYTFLIFVIIFSSQLFIKPAEAVCYACYCSDSSGNYQWLGGSDSDGNCHQTCSDGSTAFPWGSCEESVTGAGTMSQSSGNSVSLDNPLGNGNTDFNLIIGKIINAALGVVGSLALLMFIYGGFTWMLSAGSNEKVTRGKNILIWATVGLLVIFSAYALIKFILSGILGIGNSNSTS